MRPALICAALTMLIAGGCVQILGIEDLRDATPGDSTSDPDAGWDSDGDGVPDGTDNCPNIENRQQGDRDDDRVGDACDNCPDAINADQGDFDNDGAGDVCEDSDGDGALDAMDSCPAVSNDQNADEDDDGVGDACDNCPSVANPGQEDILDMGIEGTGDGVGDACDPRPEEGGDSIALFDGFTGELTDWTAESGIWSVSDGALIQTDIGAVVPEIFHKATLGDVAVETAFTVTAWDAGQDPYLDLIVDDQLNSQGYRCALETYAGSTRLRIQGTYGGSVDGILVLSEWMPAPDARYRLRHSQYGGTEQTALCTGVKLAATDTRSVQRSNASTLGPVRVGLRMKRATAAFDHVVVYGLGGAFPAAAP